MTARIDSENSAEKAVNFLSLEELAKKLTTDSRWELKPGEQVVVYGFSLSDFMDAANLPTAEHKLLTLRKIFERHFLAIDFSGSVSLDVFNLADLSWTLSAGKEQSFILHARPLPLKKS